MRNAAIFLGILLVGMLGFAWKKGQLEAVFRASWSQAGSFLPMMVVILLVMGSVEVLLPREGVERWLSDAAGWRGLGVAWLAGILTPGGGPIGLPIVAGLSRAGASPAVLVTYLCSMSLLSLLRLPMELGVLETRLVVLRLVCCAVLPLLAGGMARFITMALG